MKRPWLAAVVLILALTGCKNRAIVRMPGMDMPKPPPGALLRPMYTVAGAQVLKGGGGVVVNWPRTEGVFLTSLSDLGRFYPQLVDLSSFKASAMVQPLELSTSAQGVKAAAGQILPLDTIVALWRQNGEVWAYDGAKDLLPVKLARAEGVTKFDLASSDPDQPRRCFALIFEDTGEESLVPAKILRYDTMGGLAEVPLTITPANGTGYPLLDETGNVLGVLGRMYTVNSDKSELRGSTGEPTRAIQVAHFIGAGAIRRLLEKM